MNEMLYAFGLSLVVTLAAGPLLIPILFKLKFGQYIRSDGPKSHLKKAGTPTMGGIMFIIGTIVGTLVFEPKSVSVLVVLGAALVFGIIGFLDDFIKVVLKRSLGLRARDKLVGQFGTAILISLAAVYLLDRGTDLVIPFSGYSLTLGPVLYLLFSTVFIVGTVNAVNFADGLDGLAAGSVLITVAAWTMVALMLDPPVNQIAIFGAALMGGCLGFLKFNRHPARVFMGDTGSLALGGAVAAMAVVTGTELLFPLIGIIYLAEILSVVIQVISFRLTGKRVFRMSPLHHHYELAGWSEKKVVRSFWLVSVLGACAGLMGMYNIG